MTKTTLDWLAGLGAVAGVSWLGTRVDPVPFSPPEDAGSAVGLIPVPAELPAPVYRFLRKIGGEALPIQRTAILWGRFRARVMTLSLPLRFRSHLDAGAAFHSLYEVTWFSLPTFRRVDTLVNGMATSQTFGETQMGNHQLDRTSVLDLWTAALWTPSVLLTDPRVIWEAVDAVTARMFVPFRDGHLGFRLSFEPGSGLLRSLSTRRHRHGQRGRAEWRLEPTEWRYYAGVLVPSACRISWADEVTPRMRFVVDGLVANVDVSAHLPRRHLSAGRVNGAIANEPDWWETVAPVRG